MMAVVAEHAPERAAAITTAILAHFAGSQVYFPMASRRAALRRQLQARAAAGEDKQALAREYGVSYSGLLRLLRGE